MQNSPAIVSPMAWLRASSQKGMTQPPWVNPFLGSSSGPPGDCMTPSSVTWVIAMSLLIVLLSTFLCFVPHWILRSELSLAVLLGKQNGRHRSVGLSDDPDASAYAADALFPS